MKGKGAVHVIGAGLAGLAAAVRLSQAGFKVVVYEAASQAGGRCRSIRDLELDLTIDNGNHLVLSGNCATLSYLQSIGAKDRLTGPQAAEFDFVDLASNERWQLRPNTGIIPWWIFDYRRRVPRTRAIDYLASVGLLWTTPNQTVGAAIPCTGPVYERLWRPLLLAALNSDPAEASASLASAVLRQTLARGGAACRPLIALEGLSQTFIEPAVRFAESRQGSIRYSCRLRAIGLTSRSVESLNFGEEIVHMSPDDNIILAVPTWVASSLLPDLVVPTMFRAIVNGHFRIDPPASLARITGLINGTVEWIFSFPDRLSVTISNADRLLDIPRERIAASMWRDVAAVTGITSGIPPWQVIKERRATFAALPEENAKRPESKTRWANLFLAGDWIRTGLPATIEGAIRSGNTAAEHVIRSS
jgi:squalene-associated FAD-dependent desaturase